MDRNNSKQQAIYAIAEVKRLYALVSQYEQLRIEYDLLQVENRELMAEISQYLKMDQLYSDYGIRSVSSIIK